MATTKFREPSPFQVARPPPPPEDYLFARFQEACALAPLPDPVEQVGVALCGCGKAGSLHLGNLLDSPRVRLLYVVEDARERWPALRAYWRLADHTRLLHSDDLQQVLHDPQVGAVVVATPTQSHEALVTAALRAGKAVFCEKPLAQHADGVRRCYALAQEVQRPLLCAFNRRFDPSFSAVRRQVREGAVGHVHLIKTTSRDSPMPSLDYLRTSGGIFHDCAVHDIDLVLWVLGELPCRAVAVATANMPEIAALGDWDTVAISLAFPSGSVALVDLSRHAAYGYDQRLEVFGPRGLVRCGNERPTPGLRATDGARAPIWHSFPSRFARAYAAELHHFLDAVQGKAVLQVSSRQTLAVCKVAAALHESARTGHAVSLDWAPHEQLTQDD